MKTRELRAEVAELLRAAGVPDSAREADYLLSGVWGLSAPELAFAPDREVPEPVVERVRELARRRAGSEPLQYLLGEAPFRDLMLEVTPAVLIPRPETELLVELLLPLTPRGAAVLDLGTGSGAIALALAVERPDLHVVAVDVSDSALAVARRNAARCGVADRVEFRRSDLFDAVAGRRFAAVAANLPYVDPAEYPALDAEVRCEPRSALTAPDAGFALLERAVRALPEQLSPGGYALFELDPRQNARLRRRGTELRLAAESRRDLTGRERFVLLRRPES